jgi:hypothetical protein
MIRPGKGIKRRTDRVNLLPAAVLQERRRGARIRLWVGTSATYLALLLGVSSAVRLSTDPTAASASTELASVGDDTALTIKARQSAETQVRLTRARLVSRQVLWQQPDLSLLLRLVAAGFDDELVLRNLQLVSSSQDPMAQGQSPQGPEDREPRHFTMILRGAATSESAVTRLSTYLREPGLFNTVELKRTGRDTVNGGESIAFEIYCVLSDTPVPSAGGGR